MYIKDQLKCDIENNIRSSTPLWDTDRKSKPLRGPRTCPNVCKNTFIVLKEDFADKGRNVVPVEGELDKTVSNGTICVCKVQPNSTYGDAMVFGVPKGFVNHSSVFDTARDTFEEGLLGFQFYILVRKHEASQAFLDGREEDSSFDIQNRNGSHQRRVTSVVFFL